MTYRISVCSARGDYKADIETADTSRGRARQFPRSCCSRCSRPRPRRTCRALSARRWGSRAPWRKAERKTRKATDRFAVEHVANRNAACEHTRTEEAKLAGQGRSSRGAVMTTATSTPTRGHRRHGRCLGAWRCSRCPTHRCPTRRCPRRCPPQSEGTSRRTTR